MPKAMKSSGNAPGVLTPAFPSPAPPPTTPKDENFQHTPPDSPTQEDLKELRHAVSKMAPNGKGNPGPSPSVTMDRLKEVFESDELGDPESQCEAGDKTLLISRVELKDLLVEAISQVKAGSSTSGPSTSKYRGNEPTDPSEKDEEKKKRIRASRMDYKTVVEVWDKKASKYKIAESIVDDSNLDDLDEYVFVIREHIDSESKESTTFIDVKSDALRDILRDLLRGTKAVSLMEVKPSIERSILFHFLPQLNSRAEKLRATADSGARGLEHLLLLVKHLENAYSAVTQHLTSLLECGNITYDLLWALFSPGCLIYTTCLGTYRPRCVIFGAGEQATEKGVRYYKLECRYLDYDGRKFGETGVELGIVKFRGSKPIHTLDAFPLHHHPDHIQVRNSLIECGHTFREVTSRASGSNSGTHFRHCKGSAFVMKDREVIKMNIDSRVAIDPAFFCEMEPNYRRPRIYESWENLLAYDIMSFGTDQHRRDLERLKSNGKEAQEMTDDDLLICCPTLRCFSFSDKCFLECAVADLHEVKWSEQSFDHLQVPEHSKHLLLSLATSRLRHDRRFDDFIKGKGRGLNILLHGPPGLGKTFTVEATAERFNLPLYSISAGELIAHHGDPLNLDLTLDRIFKIARHFDAVLLLDEADVFMEKRSSYHDGHNRLVTIFLRKLEYYEGVLFLTTNRLVEFDEAILSRIHLKVKFQNLTKEGRREIWKHFLSMAITDQGPPTVNSSDFERLESMILSGRDIKNLTSVAHALATVEGIQVTSKHLEMAAKSNGKFVEEFNNSSRIEGLYT
ncbi:hypothetical protein LOZ66_006834 [Ophidiomyces ophidiicola]|nr:hypothetical protein LOZ66_006834 [Ophidiomyces ophidiicola]